jgi:nitrite reductase/ring-hydroxylating ferredoxin subunit
MLLEAAKTQDIAPGGVLGATLNGIALAICNYDGRFYAVERKCGHASARLDRGTLTGYILTCPLHYAQFDIITGEALSGPVPEAPESKYADPPAPGLGTRGLKTYPVTIIGDSVMVDLP